MPDQRRSSIQPKFARSQSFWRASGGRWLLRGAAASVLSLVLLPLIYLVVRASEAGPAALQLLVEARTMRVLARSAALALAVPLASAILAVPLAWLTTRTDLPLRKMWAVLTALPLVIPSYIFAYLLVSVLGPRGLLQQLLQPLGVERLPDIEGFPGALLALTLLCYPYLLLTVRAALLTMDPALEEAGRSLGLTPWRTFVRITLPLLRPALAGGGLLAALYTLRDFGAVSVMRFGTFTRVIYIQYQAAFDRTGAAVLALMLVALTVGLQALELNTRGRARYHRGHAAAKRKPMMVRLGPWRWPALLFCAAVALLGVGMPAAVLLFWLVRGLALGTPMPALWSATGNSVFVCLVAAPLALLGALPLVLLAGRQRSGSGRLLERVAYAAFALPGIVVGLALVFFGARYVPAIYQSVFLLQAGYLILFVPEAFSALRAALGSVNPSLMEAGRTLGRAPAQVLRSITLPLMRNGVLAALAIVFLTAMKELPATLILAPPGMGTLATSIWGAVTQAYFAAAALPAVLLIGISSVPLAIFTLRETYQ